MKDEFRVAACINIIKPVKSQTLIAFSHLTFYDSRNDEMAFKINLAN
jgi:hypothetical protein